jgi:polysaccharide chain length determinant protein (PEP-CTERM system associated)
MIVGIYLAITLPKIYEASTLIMVEPQEVPSNFVRSIVTADVRSRISTLSEQITSRTNLERIINKFGLFSGPESRLMFMEDKVAIMRDKIEVNVTRTQGFDTFSVSYMDPDPDTAMHVANDLATAFIEENIKVRENQAIGTSEFLETQLESTRKKLEIVEEKMRNYRKRYMGELPEELESNQKALDRLQNQLNETHKSIRDAKNRLILLENRINARSQFQSTLTEDKPGSKEPVTLDQLKEQLEALSAKYTDQHPDVIQLRTRIKDLEAKEKETEYTVAKHSGSTRPNSKKLSSSDRFLVELAEQRQAILLEIGDLESEIAKIKHQINIYQRHIENTPKREEELMGLKRDYKNIQDSYNSLLNRKLEADISLNLEKKQKGEQFRIIDAARLPRKPASPDMRKLFLMTVAVGFGLGGGLIFLLDLFDTSLKDPEKFEDELGLSVLATIPKVYQKKDIRLKKLNRVLTGVSLLVAVCLFAGFAILVLNGVEPTMEIVRPYLASFRI